MFDRVYSLVGGFSSLSPSCKINLVESLRSNFSVLLPNIDSLSRVSEGEDDESPVIERLTSHRNAFKIYTFFLFSIIFAEDSNISPNNNAKVLIIANFLY